MLLTRIFALMAILVLIAAAGCDKGARYGDKKEDWAKRTPPPQWRGPGQPGGPPPSALTGPGGPPPGANAAPGAPAGAPPGPPAAKP